MYRTQNNENFRSQLRQKQLSGVAAAALLSKNGSGADISRMSRMLHNDDPMVREGTIRSMAKMGSRQAVGAMLHCLRDRDPRVRTATCIALGQLRAHQAKTQLYDALYDKDPNVCCAAAGALASMGDKIGLPQVAKLLRTTGKHQWQALRSLNQITGQTFRINEHGLKDAICWINAKRKIFKK